MNELLRSAPRARAWRVWLAVLLIALMVLAGASAALGSQMAMTLRQHCATDGGEPNSTCEYAELSANGRFVAYWSEATNLVDGDTNGEGDIFVFDSQTGQVERVSLANNGSENVEYSEYPKISGDGRFVLFETSGKLVPADTDSRDSLYVRDRLLGKTILASLTSTGALPNERCGQGDISTDGRYVSFGSSATNIVPGDTNGKNDVFVRDLVAGTTTGVSVASNGAQATGDSYESAISEEGPIVAFYSLAGNLAPDTNGASDIFAHNMASGSTVKVSVATNEAETSAYSTNPDISGNGRYVVFQSPDQNLVAGINNPGDDIFIRDLLLGTTKRVTVDVNGGDASAGSQYPSISWDGRFVTFDSDATDLVAGDNNGQHDVFVRDMVLGKTMIGSVSSAGAQGDDSSFEGSVASAGTNYTVAYYSSATNLVSPPQVSGDYQVYLSSLTDFGSDGATAVAGTNRYTTAVEISKASFPTGSSTVIIATALNWPDALGGAALAGAYDAPILLVKTAEVPSVVASEIKRLGADHAIILGGVNAVSDAVKTQLEAVVGKGNVEKVAGQNRYLTAQAVADAAIEKLGVNYDGMAFAATGMDFPDSLAASPISFARGVPIYLVNPKSAAPTSVMKGAGVTDVAILGGTNAVSGSAESAIKTTFGASNVERLAGGNRYATGVVIAAWGVNSQGLSWDGTAFGTGMDFPDALAGSALPGRNGSVVLLTGKDTLPSPVKSSITANKSKITTYYYLGGTNAVSQTVRNEIDAILK